MNTGILDLFIFAFYLAERDGGHTDNFAIESVDGLASIPAVYLSNIPGESDVIKTDQHSWRI